jgi:hypothetical protein
MDTKKLVIAGAPPDWVDAITWNFGEVRPGRG